MFKRYPKIFNLGHEETDGIFDNAADIIYVQEKIDGANGSFWFGGAKLHFGKRSGELDAAQAGQFQAGVNWLSSHLRDVEKGLGSLPNPDLVYYFEYMLPHTLQYAWDSVPKVVIFDIFDRDAEKFVVPKVVGAECLRLDLPTISTIQTIPVHEIIQRGQQFLEEYIRRSDYGADKMEGIVLKNYNGLNKWGRPLFAKIVAHEFREENKRKMGRLPTDVEDEANRDTQRFCDAYFTDARVRKTILKLLDEGAALDRGLMKHAPMNLIYDAVEENYHEVFRKFDRLDIRSIKRTAAGYCLRAVDRMMIERCRVGVGISGRVVSV